MATDAPFMQRHQRAIMLVLVLMVIPTFGIAGPEIYAFIQTLRDPLKDAVGTFELVPGETVGVSEKEFLAARQNLWTVRGILGAGDAPTPEMVWSHLIKVAKARHLGVAVSDEDLATVLRRMGFATSPELYRSFVSSRGLTVSIFEKLVREIMLTEKLDELEGTPPLHTADRVYERFKNDKRRYKLDTVSFTAANYADKVGADAWTDEDLQKSWDEGANAIAKNSLRIPAQFTLDVAYAPFDTYPIDELGELLQGIDASESEMLNHYSNPLAQDRYREKPDPAAAPDAKGELKPFDAVKDTIRREIKIRKVLDKAYAEAAEAKKAIDDAKAERDRKAEEEALKAEEEKKKAESAGGDGSGAAGDGAKKDETGAPAETPKTPDEKKMPPEPLQDGAPATPPPPAAEDAAPPADDRLDLTAIITKYKLSRATLESLDDKELKTAKLGDSLEASINVFGLADRSLVPVFEGPGAVAGFGVVSGFEADRMPELSAVKEEFRTALKDKKAFDLAYEDAQALQKSVKEATEKRHEAKKPAAIRERELKQKEAEEAAKKKREEEEQKAKEEAEKAKAAAEGAAPKEGAGESTDPAKTEKPAEEPPKDAGTKPPGDGGGRSSLPPPAPPQGGEAAPPAAAAPPTPAPATDEPVKELTEAEWSELMLTDLGVSFDEYVKEKNLEVRTTDWLTLAPRNTPEYAAEKDPQLKYLRSIGGIRNLRIGQVNIYRDNEAKAAYAVKMKEKQDPAWEELSSERAAELLSELYQSSTQNRNNIMSQMGFENLAREVKLATLLRSQPPPATTGLPRRMP